MREGFVIGIALGVASVWIAYRLAKPSLRDAIEQQVLSELRSLPPGVLTASNTLLGEGVHLAIARGAADAIMRKLP